MYVYFENVVKLSFLMINSYITDLIHYLSNCKKQSQIRSKLDLNA